MFFRSSKTVNFFSPLRFLAESDIGREREREREREWESLSSAFHLLLVQSETLLRTSTHRPVAVFNRRRTYCCFLERISSLLYFASYSSGANLFGQFALFSLSWLVHFLTQCVHSWSLVLSFDFGNKMIAKMERWDSMYRALWSILQRTMLVIYDCIVVI